MTIKRVMRPGPWGYLLSGLMCTLLAIAFSALVEVLIDPDALIGMGGLYIFLAGGLLRTRIIIDSESIEFRPAYWRSKRVMFKEIGYGRVTRIQTVRDSYLPYALDLYRSGSSIPAMTIWLASFRSEDRDWLLKLPQLRIGEEP